MATCMDLLKQPNIDFGKKEKNMFKFMKPYLTLVTIVLFGIVIAVATTFYIQKKNLEIELANANTKTLSCQAELTKQNEQLLQNKKDFDDKLKQMPMAIDAIKREYNDKINEIENWRKKNEKATCTDAISRLNSHIF